MSYQQQHVVLGIDDASERCSTEVLIANAAQKWSVDPATLKTEPSVVVDPASGARLSYGEIASFGTIPANLPTLDVRDAWQIPRSPRSLTRSICFKKVET